MKPIFKLTLVIVGMLYCYDIFAQNNHSVIDILTKKVYDYENIESNIDENDCVNYKNGSIYVPRFTNLIDTNVQKSINNRMQAILVKNIASSLFVAKLSTQAIEAEKTYLRDEKSSSRLPKCELNRILYYPEITRVKYCFTSCFNQVVTMAASYTYHTRVKNNKRLKGLVYTEIYYFDLNTGKEYTQADIFKPNTSAALDALIIQKYNRNEIFTGSKFLMPNHYYDEEYNDNDTRDEEEVIEEIDVESGETGYADLPPPVAEERVYKEMSDDIGVQSVDGGNYNGSGSNYYDRGDINVSPAIGEYANLPIYKEETYKPKINFYPEEFLPVERKISNFTSLKNGFLQLKAASISYTLAAYQTCNNLPYNTAAEIRLGLNEIQQYINPNGPYASLINWGKNIKNGVQKMNTPLKNFKLLNYAPQLDIVDNNPLEIADKSIKKIKVFTKEKQRIKFTNMANSKSKDTIVNIWIKELTYKNGQLIQIMNNQSYDYYNTYISYEYDSLNRIQKIINRNSDSNFVSCVIYNYNSENNITTEKHCTDNGQVDYCIYYTYFENFYIAESFQNNQSVNDFNYTQNYFNTNSLIDSSFEVTTNGISSSNHYIFTKNGEISYRYEYNTATENGSYFIYNNTGKLTNYVSESNYNTLFIYDNNSNLETYLQNQEDGEITKEINLTYNKNNQLESYKATNKYNENKTKLYFINYSY